ncbi:MAG TPA: DNA methyltransferase, partial [Polyangiaceae bacterium]|nr:DNA methyltransferase [Polyangiaceae bacterium]
MTRRSLTHVGGEVETAGSRAISEALAASLDVAPADPGAAEADGPDRVHVHGFHTYPARMHPATASRLVVALSGAGATVLDPFCGSGTVLVEAMIAGRRAVGTDLNPIAVKLAALKTTPRDAPWIEGLVGAAHEVAAVADERRKRRAGASRRYPADDVAAFDPHVLLELDSLR